MSALNPRSKPGRKVKPDTRLIEGSGVGNEVPEMPSAAMYGLSKLAADDHGNVELQPLTEWPDACVRAWEMIWTSELAASYLASDRLQAEAAVLHLASAVDPLESAASRRASNKEYQSSLEKLGLNPSARSKLKLSIVAADEAENKRGRRQPPPQPQSDHQAEIVDLYRRNQSG